MTRQEALILFKSMYLCDIFVNGTCKTICDVEVDLNAFINYLMKVDVPYEVVYDFCTEEIEFADMNGKPTNDDPDYLNLYITKKGKVKLLMWTEVCGIEYDLEDYGKTWTVVKEQKPPINKSNNKALEQFMKAMTSALPEVLLPKDVVKIEKLNDNN